MEKALTVRIGANISDLTRTLKTATGKIQKMGKRLSEVGQSMSVGVTLPLVGAATQILRTAGDFEASMNKVQAISGATGQQFEQLKNQAKNLGSTTQFSASEAADAMTFLSMAGFSVEETYKSMPATLNLAAAAQMDMGTSADIVSNIMSGFGLKAEDLGGAVDVLAKQFTTSNTDLRQLGEAMKYVGTTASSMGFSLEETSAAVGMLSDAGLQASMAGTGLRRIISTLAKNSKKLGIDMLDASGKARPLYDLIAQLEQQGLTTGEVMQEFGENGGPALQVLLERGSDAIRKQTESLKTAGGTADKLAKAQMKGLNGALKALKSAFEGLAIAIAESGLLDFVASLVKKVTAFVRGLADANPAMLKMGTLIAALAAAIGPVLVIFGTFASTVLPAIVSGFAALTGPIGLIIGAVAALAASIMYIAENWEAVKERVSDISWWKNALIEMIALIAEYNPFSTIIETANMAAKAFGSEGFGNPFKDMASDIRDAKDETKDYKHEFGSLSDAIVNQSKKAIEAMSGLNIDSLFQSGGGSTETKENPSILPNGLVENFKQAEQATKSFGESANLSLQKVGIRTIEMSHKVSQMGQQFSQMGQKAAISIGHGITNSLQNAITTGQDFGKAMIDMLKNLIAKIIAAAAAAAILNAILGGAGGGFSSLFGQFSGLGGIGGGAMSTPTIPGRGNAMNRPVVMDTVVRGEDLLLTQRRAESRENRYR